jgi:hypothetical protein
VRAGDKVLRIIWIHIHNRLLMYQSSVGRAHLDVVANLDKSDLRDQPVDSDQDKEDASKAASSH